jgi:5-methyltetrahydropteroyltriglutamate--homocysteine methyltransferase
MATRVCDALLPTTMVGSYPRPRWFTQQLQGRDVLEAFKSVEHAEAYRDATRVVIGDQEDAGLDIVTDGQMWFDDLHMGIGSFFWYWFERIPGFGPEMVLHRNRDRASGRDVFVMDEAGSAILRGEVARGPLRLAYLYQCAQDATTKPVKASVGAGPCQLSGLVHFESGRIRDRFELSAALAEVFNAELLELQAAGCSYVQYEDLGAWTPNLTGGQDFAWVTETVNRVLAGVTVRKAWHFCLGNAWGNRLDALVRGGYGAVVPHYRDVDVDELTLDFACREMADAAVLKEIPADVDVGVGVIDVRNLEIEQPEQVAERIRTVLGFVDAERVTLTTDCGMKQLPRPVAAAKLRSLDVGAAIVRHELLGQEQEGAA